MRAVRSRIRLGSWLALFALTVQFALSFGHLHVGGIHPRSFASARVLRSASAPGMAAVRTSGPAQQSPDRPIDPVCAVCAVTQLAGSVVPAAAPTLPLPIAHVRVSLGVGIEFATAVSPQLSFEARAPPRA